MGEISASYDMEKNLTHVKATGTMTAEDFYRWLVTYYEGDITLLTLWDLTQADILEISTDDVKEIARRTRKVASGARQGGKSALVFNTTSHYGMGRMFETYAELANLPFEFRAFQNFDDAKDWLGV